MNVKPRLREAIDRIEKEVHDALCQFAFEDPLAANHLERARAHLNEAWISADGQNARTVQKLIEDLAESDKLRYFALSAKPGDIVEAFGKKWRLG
ncbi:MAG: hypothetical protein WBN22_00985 [Verrucomicrobiia bacterium]